MRANTFRILRHVVHSRTYSGVECTATCSSRLAPSPHSDLLRHSPCLPKHHQARLLYHLYPCSNHLWSGPAIRHRCYTSSADATIASFPDPTRPDIFYHLVRPPTPFSSSRPAFALSFLSSPPPLPDSCTIIGWLPAASDAAEQEAGLNDFIENRQSFSIILHTNKSRFERVPRLNCCVDCSRKVPGTSSRGDTCWPCGGRR
jgi:hypothetical protein